MTRRPLNSTFGKLIEDWSRNPPFETWPPLHAGPHCHIGSKIIGVRGTPHDKLVVGTQNDVVIDIALQPDHLILAVSLTVSGDNNERHVIHVDPPAFDRRDKPVATIRLTPQHTCKKLHQRRSRYESTFMIPASISGDTDVEFLRRRAPDIAQHIPAITVWGDCRLFGLSGGWMAFGFPVHALSLA